MTQQWLVIRVVLRLSKLSHARGSVSRKWFCHLVQEDLSPARVSVMQVVLSHARGSVIKVAEYMTQQWLVIRVVLRLSKLSHARGSVSCKGFCHLVQEDLSCKSICHASGSISKL